TYASGLGDEIGDGGAASAKDFPDELLACAQHPCCAGAAGEERAHILRGGAEATVANHVGKRAGPLARGGHVGDPGENARRCGIECSAGGSLGFPEEPARIAYYVWREMAAHRVKQTALT